MAAREEPVRTLRAMAGYGEINPRPSHHGPTCAAAAFDNASSSSRSDDTASAIDDSTEDAPGVQEPPVFDTGYQEVHEGISMWIHEVQPSPVTAHGKYFFAVDFDESTSISDAEFHNCIFINVSFKDCFLRGARFYNVFLQDVEFVGCTFHDVRILSKRLADAKWTDKTFEQQTIMDTTMPSEIAQPAWLANLMKEQTPFPRSTAAPPPGYRQNLADFRNQTTAAHSASEKAYDLREPSESEYGVFDFSSLGKIVHMDPNVDVEHVTRHLAEWNAYAVEKERERELERKRENGEEASGETPEQTSAEQQGLATRSPRRSQPNVLDSVATGLAVGRDTVPTSQTPVRAPTDVTNRASQRSYGMRPARELGQLSDHFIRASKAAVNEEDDDDEPEGPVYRPASRLRC